MRKSVAVALIAGLGLTSLTSTASVASNVKVTPLGGITGEFCRLDRAILFEDPDGTRIL